MAVETAQFGQKARDFNTDDWEVYPDAEGWNPAHPPMFRDLHEGAFAVADPNGINIMFSADLSWGDIEGYQYKAVLGYEGAELILNALSRDVTPQEIVQMGFEQIY